MQHALASWDHQSQFGADPRYVPLCGVGLQMARYLTELLTGGYAGSFTFELVTPAYWLDPRCPLGGRLLGAQTAIGAPA